MLLETREGTTVVLTLDNPARRNALARPMRTALLEAITRIEADRDARAIVVTGAGGNFCSGGDIESMNESSDLAAGRERFRQSHDLVRLFLRCSKPIIAAVEGWAAGAGVGLALCCDTIVADEKARFVASFGRVGLVADFGLLHTLPARVGHGHARTILLYGEPVDAPEAHRIGMIDRLAPPGQALAVALERADRFAGSAPLSLAYTKAALARNFDAVLDWERETQAALLQTHDHREGRAAFLEKRAPNFTGR